MNESMEVCFEGEVYALFIDGGWGHKWVKIHGLRKKKNQNNPTVKIYGCNSAPYLHPKLREKITFSVQQLLQYIAIYITIPHVRPLLFLSS